MSRRGFLHCNRSFDVPSIFARTVDDAYAVLEVVQGYDPEDDFSERAGAVPASNALARGFRVAIPRASQLEFFGDRASARQFARVLEHLRELGAEPIEIDFSPFLSRAA